MTARLFTTRPGAPAPVVSSLVSALALTLAAAAVPAAAATPRPSRVERISTTAEGTEADGASASAVISDDGRHAAFLSKAENLGCSGGYPCMRVRDLATGAVTTVSEGGGFWWGAPTISPDGRYIGYSAGSKLPAPYLLDRRTGQSRKIWPADPPPGVELGELWSLSRHGAQVAYVLGNRHGSDFTGYLYVRDLATGTDELISGTDEPPKAAASLSANGATVAYMTADSAGDDPADTADVFVVDRATGRKVQADSGLGSARLIQLSGDGRYVVLDARNGTYVRDLRTGRLDRVADAPATSASRDTRLLLLSGADGLRLLDRRTGRSAAVGPAGSEAGPGAVSAKGRVVFGSAADDLVPGDTNGAPDIFVYRPR
ncbi:hypothetical protein [Streptomyces sp. SID2888]|uniref:hypothetical protein n=1 Tax=Streptomyces sp. SID2888 TaxID=2690256 RepID=UPI00136AA3A8|nr:hypothetical protein [Streptomyces sp. SID2888]MYV48969.1 hypothetical protein [Streptomyces sp. SID2888]